jgi:hypothetical protein
MTRIDDLNAFPVTNQSLPSADFVTRGPYSLVALERSLTPSVASQTVVAILRFGSAIHASTSVRVIRTRPQRMYNHSEPSSSSIVQFVPSQGKPFLLVSVATRPSLIRLSPPFCVAAHSAPSRSR